MSWSAWEAMATVEVKADPEKVVAPVVAKFVLSYLAGRADDKGEAWPSIDSIAAFTGTSRRTAQRALRVLVEQGLVSVATTGGGRSKATRYRLHLPVNRDSGVTESREGNSVSTGTESDPERVTVPARKGDSTAQKGRQHCHPNTTNAKNEVLGGGGEGSTSSAHAEEAADIIAFHVEGETGAPISTTLLAGTLADHLDRLTAEGWNADLIAAEVLTDWPAKITSSAGGLTASRITAIAGPPPWQHLARWAEKAAGRDVATLAACPHLDDPDLDGYHYRAFHAELTDHSEDLWAHADHNGTTVECMDTRADADLIIASARRHAQACIDTRRENLI